MARERVSTRTRRETRQRERALAVFDENAHPADYAAGVATAQRLIEHDLDRVSFALRLVETQLGEDNPRSVRTEQQYARSRGFRDCLREYLNDRSDA
jgi:hypothetical protein